MNQAHIKIEAEEIRDEIRRHSMNLEGARARLRTLQQHCPHPNAFPTSHMGEDDRTCPDCGNVT